LHNSKITDSEEEGTGPTPLEHSEEEAGVLKSILHFFSRGGLADIVQKKWLEVGGSDYFSVVTIITYIHWKKSN